MIVKELDYFSLVCNKEIDLLVCERVWECLKFKGSLECEVMIKKDFIVNLLNKNSLDYLIEWIWKCWNFYCFLIMFCFYINFIFMKVM